MKLQKLKLPTMNNVYAIVAVFFSVLFTNNSLFFGTNHHTFWSYLTMIVTALAALLLCARIVTCKLYVRGFNFVLMFGLCFFIVLTMLYNLDFRMGYIYKMALIVMAWGIAEHVGLKKFVRYYDKLMTLLATASIVGFLLKIVGAGILRIFPIITNVSGYEFYNLFLCNVPNFVVGFPRNYGIFREPGVFQMYLTLAILFQMTVMPKMSIWKVAVYVVAVVTTFSSVGYLALVLLFALVMIRKDLLDQKMKKILWICLGAVAVLALLIPGIRNELFRMTIGKLSTKSETAASTISRLASIVVNLKEWGRSFLFGVGITQLDKRFPLLTLQIYGEISPDNTNMLLMQFAQHGLFFGAVWVWAYGRMAWNLGKTVWEKLLIGGIFLLMLMSQNYSYSLITTMLLFFAFADSSASGTLFTKRIANPIAERMAGKQ